MRTREYRPWHIVDLFYISVCAECIKDRLTSSDSAGELEDTPWACPRAPLGGPRTVLNPMARLFELLFTYYPHHILITYRNIYPVAPFIT